MKKRVAVFGTGKLYEQKKHLLQNVKIVVFFDNDEKKHGKMLDGVIVAAPDQHRLYHFDYIIIMSIYYNDIMSQLSQLNIDDNKYIYYLELDEKGDYEPQYTYDLNKLINAIDKDKIVLLVTNELSLTGAPIVLYYMSCVFQNLGYNPIVISLRDGDLKHDFFAKSVPVIVEPYASVNNQYLKLVVQKSEVIVFNTATVGFLIPKFQKFNKNILWWIHESASLYKSIYFHQDLKRITSQIKICAVSEVAKRNFCNEYSKENIYILPFGLPDTATENNEKPSSKLTMAIIGTIHPIKGYDILIEALLTLEDSTRNHLKVISVGKMINESITQNFSDKFTDAVNEGLITHLGEMSRNEVEKIIKEVDIIVCASREETMSAVVVEGMMHSKVCIVSDSAGICEYLIDKENVLIFNNLSSKDLARKIEWCILRSENLKTIGCNARKTFKQFFSLDVFEKNLENLLSM